MGVAMANTNRPLSPHLQVYRPQLTSMMSILHRATGVGLAGGLLLMMWWLVALASADRSITITSWGLQAAGSAVL